MRFADLQMHEPFHFGPTGITTVEAARAMDVKLYVRVSARKYRTWPDCTFASEEQVWSIHAIVTPVTQAVEAHR